MKVCSKFTIYGRVQAVGFRWSTQKKAESLGITGYAKNMPEGSVEALVCGDEEKIEEFSKWLEEGGPRLSNISKVDRAKADLDTFPVTFDTM